MTLRVLPGGDAPPHNLEAERQVLGSCLLKPELLEQMDLQTQDFWSESNRRIWSVLQYLAAEGLPVDELHLRERLSELGQLASVGGVDYLLELTSTVPDVVPADIVRKLSRQRGAQAAGKRLAKAAESGDLEDAQTAVREAQRVLEDSARKPVVEWRSTLDVFAPLPPVSWRVRGLQICAGRPSMFVGYGASAKTLSAQALLLACATGRPVWGHFETSPLKVRHLDFEQGWHATARRYQRLAYGYQIDPREAAENLRVAVFPDVYLDQPGAADAYAKVCDGAELVVIDSFKASTPTRDENDNGIRTCVDVLTRVSEKTGCAFLVLHHAGKAAPGDRDARALGRGASAIFDAAGSWFNFFSGGKDEPRTVKQAKQPAEAEGGGVPDFHLDVLDVHAPSQLNAGVRVVYKPVSDANPVAVASEKYDARISALLSFIRAHPGLAKAELVGRVGMGSNTVHAMLDVLAGKGAIRITPGAHGAHHIYPSNSHTGSSGPPE